MKFIDNINQFIQCSDIKTRPNAGPGLWLMFLFPMSLIVSVSSHPLISSSNYKLSSIFSVGIICSSLVFLYKTSKKKRLNFLNVWLLIASIAVTILFQICLHRGIIFSLWSGITSTVLYLRLYFLILKKLPMSFTLGEAALCAQSYIMLLYFTSVNAFNSAMKPPTTTMQISTLIIQIGLCGISTIALLVYLFNVTSPTKFYSISIFVFIFVVLLPLHFLLKKSALLWIIDQLWNDLINSKIVLYWSFCSTLAVLVISRKVKSAKKASTTVRKVFHILTVAVFIPGLLYNCSLLYLASGIVFGLFFILEILRVLNVPPLGSHLQNGLVVFGDDKDVGVIAFTPMYLLAGCALPLWMHPAPCDVTNSAVFNLLPLLSGLLTIGVGDTAASIVGSKFGRHYWKDSKKTIEGTVACVLSQLMFIVALVQLDFLKFFNAGEYIKVVVAVIVTSLIEAKTDQVDNLVVPFIMYIVLIL